MKRKFLWKHGILHNAVGQPLHIAAILPAYALICMAVPFVFLAKTVQELSVTGWAKLTGEFVRNVFR